MGFLLDGQWQAHEDRSRVKQGTFMRSDSQFRHWITADGSAGPSGDAGFKAEPNRYHLYISHACPWAHRTMIFRALKGLEDMIPVSVAHWLMNEQSWNFAAGPGVIPDSVNGVDYIHQLYSKANPSYSGRVTVPVLWDKATSTIVNNESSEIIRMFNSAFDDVGAAEGDYYPAELRADIDEVNDRIYNTLNNGVYKAGFATSQGAYEDAVVPLFDTLKWLEQRLSQQRYLVGKQITEADWRLFTTLVRFDCVYVGHFKCNLKRLIDFSNVWDYTRDLYQQPKITDTVHFDHIKNHYYQSHESVNPTRIVPLGPLLDFTQPVNRG